MKLIINKVYNEIMSQSEYKQAKEDGHLDKINVENLKKNKELIRKKIGIFKKNPTFYIPYKTLSNNKDVKKIVQEFKASNISSEIKHFSLFKFFNNLPGYKAPKGSDDLLSMLMIITNKISKNGKLVDIGDELKALQNKLKNISSMEQLKSSTRKKIDKVPNQQGKKGIFKEYYKYRRAFKKAFKKYENAYKKDNNLDMFLRNMNHEYDFLRREIKRDFQNTDGFIVVFSMINRKIASMSTCTGWSSCMNLYSGQYKSFVPKTMESPAFIVWLAKSGDEKLLESPTARILCKPYYGNKGDIIWMASKVYGDAPSSFRENVQKFLDKNFNTKLERRDDFYIADKRNYADSVDRKFFSFNVNRDSVAGAALNAYNHQEFVPNPADEEEDEEEQIQYYFENVHSFINDYGHILMEHLDLYEILHERYMNYLEDEIRSIDDEVEDIVEYYLNSLYDTFENRDLISTVLEVKDNEIRLSSKLAKLKIELYKDSNFIDDYFSLKESQANVDTKTNPLFDKGSMPEKNIQSEINKLLSKYSKEIGLDNAELKEFMEEYGESLSGDDPEHLDSFIRALSDIEDIMELDEFEAEYETEIMFEIVNELHFDEFENLYYSIEI